MRRSSFENLPCPVAQALDLIGDSWNVLILREAFYGSTRFDQFLARLGIASNVLTRRLRALVDTRTGRPVRIALVDADSGEAIGPQHQIHRREGDQLVPAHIPQADHA